MRAKILDYRPGCEGTLVIIFHAYLLPHLVAGFTHPSRYTFPTPHESHEVVTPATLSHHDIEGLDDERQESGAMARMLVNLLRHAVSPGQVL